jgi:hypothetical protein
MSVVGWRLKNPYIGMRESSKANGSKRKAVLTCLVLSLKQSGRSDIS